MDTTVAHVARVYDYMLGGSANFAVDREAAERSAEPVGGIEVWRASTRSNRAFLGRVVRWLAEEQGVRQFLDLGSGLPTAQNVHQAAQAAAPESRVVYVDVDSTVLAHAHELLEGSEEGGTAYVIGDLRGHEAVLEQAAATLDFAEPVGVLLFTILHNLHDADDPWGVVARYADAVCSGSYLAISHLTGDFDPEVMAEVEESLNRDMAEPFVLRTRDQIRRFFDGAELVPPGLVHINEWRPDDAIPPTVGIPAPIVGAVGRKP